jgi:hypothetical protein
MSIPLRIQHRFLQKTLERGGERVRGQNLARTLLLGPPKWDSHYKFIMSKLTEGVLRLFLGMVTLGLV